MTNGFVQSILICLIYFANHCLGEPSILPVVVDHLFSLLYSIPLRVCPTDYIFIVALKGVLLFSRVGILQMMLWTFEPMSLLNVPRVELLGCVVDGLCSTYKGRSNLSRSLWAKFL